MHLLPPSGYDPNAPTPGIFLAVQLGVGIRSVGSSRRACVLANKLAAGTATVEELVQVPSPDEADALFGARSEAARACRAIFAQKPGAEVWACPVAENGSGVQATATLAFANNAGTAGVVRVVVSGTALAEVTVAAGDTPTTIAAAVSAVIGAATHLPCTASPSSGTVTITAAQKGPRGNELAIECVLTTTTTTVALNGGTPSTTVVRGRFGTGTATAGAGADDFTNALAALATREFLLVAACTDATNLGRVRTHLATYAGITYRRRQQAVCALKALTVAAAIAFNTGGSAINATRIQIAYARDANAAGTVVDPWTPEAAVIAAAVAAGRLYGDAAVGNGGTVRGEISSPACNLDGLQLAAIPAPRLSSVPLTEAEQAQVMNAGLSPLAPSVGTNPGYQQLVKSVTSYWFDTSSNLTRAVHDTSKVTVSDYTAQRLEARLRADFPNKNIAPEPAEPAPPPTPEVVFVSMLRAAAVDELGALEREGQLVRVQELADAVLFEQHVDNPSLVLGQIPIDVIDHLHALAGTVQQTG